MKIFNWVHRMFNHNALKDEFGIRDWDKKEVESQTNIELELEVAVDGSMLSIGTFGFHHPCIHQQHNDEDHYPITTSYQKITEIQEPAHHHQVADDIIQEQGDDDESEAKPLMFTKFIEYGFDMTSPNNNNTTSTTIMSVNGISLMPEITTSIVDDHKKKGEIRTTLADLFLADSHDAQINSNSKADLNTKKRAPADTKNNASFAKKLIPQVGDKSQLANKLNQMMKRVMKRKIHPEHHNVQPTPPENMDSLEVQPIDESTYLLPIPGVIV